MTALHLTVLLCHPTITVHPGHLCVHAHHLLVPLPPPRRVAVHSLPLSTMHAVPALSAVHSTAFVPSHSPVMPPHLTVHLSHGPTHLLHGRGQRVGGGIPPPEALVPGLNRIA
jgi:hypothetical protein